MNSFSNRYPFKAMDADGKWHAFKARPFMLGDKWTTGDESEKIDLNQYGSSEQRDWRQTLLYDGILNG